MCVCVCVCVCVFGGAVCARACVCVRACMRACVRAARARFSTCECLDVSVCVRMRSFVLELVHSNTPVLNERVLGHCLSKGTGRLRSKPMLWLR